MSPDSMVDALRAMIDKITHVEWLATAITIAIIVIIAFIATVVLSKMLRTLLDKGKGPLPSSSIFVNILRAVIWTLAACIILSSCFNVNVGALVAALGVTGIAVSLGFQSTLSNLIGGLQVSLTGLVKPGDHITVNNQTGVVRDVTWSHTALTNSSGENVVIPNSVITSTAIIHRLPPSRVSIPLHVTVIPEKGGMSQLAEDVENAVNEVLNGRYTMKKPAAVSFSSTSDNAIVGSLSFQVADSRDANEATDAAIRAMAPYVHMGEPSGSEGDEQQRKEQEKK